MGTKTLCSRYLLKSKKRGGEAVEVTYRAKLLSLSTQFLMMMMITMMIMVMTVMAVVVLKLVNIKHFFPVSYLPPSPSKQLGVGKKVIHTGHRPRN